MLPETSKNSQKAISKEREQAFEQALISVFEQAFERALQRVFDQNYVTGQRKIFLIALDAKYGTVTQSQQDLVNALSSEQLEDLIVQIYQVATADKLLECALRLVDAHPNYSINPSF